MDNNLPEAVIQEKNNFNIILITVLIITSLLFIAWYITSNKNQDNHVVEESNNVDNSNIEIRTLSAKAIIKSIDYPNNEMSVVLSPSEFAMGEAVNFGADSKKLKLSQGTIIQKLITAKDASGSVVRSENIEINLENLKEGDELSIVFNGRPNDTVLNNVQSISSIINVDDSKFTETIANESNKITDNSISFTKGQVVSVDSVNSKIEYLPYIFNKLSDEKNTMMFGSGTGIFSVSDEKRFNIKHARKVINISDIKVGDKVFFAFKSDANISSTDTKAEAIIIINNQ
jgi:Cu/Ag efflux protein CusF